MYDVYLLSSCSKPIDIAHLPIDIRPLAKRGLEKSKPDFLGLNLSRNLAADFVKQLHLAGGNGLVVLSAYRQPKVTIEIAYTIAEKAIYQKQEKHFPNFKFESVKFLSEAAMWWEFGADSAELIEQGYIPGGIRVRVDKLDGHIWTLQEEVSLYGEEYYLESATSLDPKEILNIFYNELCLDWVIDRKNQNKTCLKKDALVINATKHAFPIIVEKFYSFCPNVHIQFRIIPYEKGSELAHILMLKSVTILLRLDRSDAVLVFDAGYPVTVLQQSSGKLTLDTYWDRWTETEIAEVMLPYEKAKLSQPQM